MSQFRSLGNYTNTQLKVDREKGIIYDVSIVEVGPNKNGTHFGQTYIDALAAGANEQTQGVKSRFGHPNMCNTSLGDFIGRYKNFKSQEGKATADLHLDEITRKTEVEGKGIKMFDYIMDMAENNPDMFGNSIHIPRPVYEKKQVEVDGAKYDSHIYNGIVASDLVGDPAATGGLFGLKDDLGVVMSTFFDQNPEIFEVINENPALIGEFFSKYQPHYIKKHNKDLAMANIFEQIQNFFSSDKGGDNTQMDVEWTLATGEVVDVITESDEPQKGDEVKKKDGSPLEDGEHVDKDGKTWNIVGGKIDSIADAEADDAEADADDAETNDTDPTNQEVMQSISDLGAKFDKYFKDNNGALESMLEGHKTLNSKFEALAKGIGSEFDIEDADEHGMFRKKDEAESTVQSLRDRKQEIADKKK